MFGYKVKPFEWQDEAQAYRDRQEYVENIEQMLKWIELDREVFYSKQDLIAWLTKRKSDAIKKEEKRIEENKKRHCDDVGTSVIVQTGEIVVLGEMIEIVKNIEMPGENSDDIIIRLLEEKKKRELTLIEERDLLICKCQVALEKIKRLICRRRPKWNKAGDIMMHLYDNLFMRGIKHEIHKHVEFDYEKKVSIEEAQKWLELDLYDDDFKSDYFDT